MYHFSIPGRRLLTIGLFGLSVLPGLALYRGDEYKPRDFRIGSEYFIDRLDLLPTIEARLRYRDAVNAYQLASGSYTKEDLFLIQNLKLQTGLLPDTTFEFKFDMDQDFDGIYEHHFLGLAYPSNGIWSAEALGEPMARKEYADAGLALRRIVNPAEQARAEFILPDFVFNDKNDDDASYVKRPYNFRFYAWQPIVTQLEVFASADLDFPSETDYVGPQFNFSYYSYKPSAGVIWTLADQQMLWAEGYFETTDKERAGYNALDPKSYHTERTVYIGRLEYVRGVPEDKRYTAGFQYVSLQESNDYPNDPKKYEDLDHLSRIVYTTYRFPLAGRLGLMIGLYVDVVRHRDDYPYYEEDTRHDDGWEGKVPFTLDWTDKWFCVSGGVAAEIDQAQFGGGFVGATAIF